MSKTCKRRFLSSIGITIVAVLAIGVAWNSMNVPAAKAAGGDGATNNITLWDTNANGKIDRIIMGIANPNFGAEQMVVNANWNDCLDVQYNGVDITISGTPSIPAGADPAVLTIDLSESDTDLLVNTDAVNTMAEIEVIYTGAAIGQCIDDGTDEDMNDIAGDTGAADTEIDMASPVIVSAVYQDSGSADGTVDLILTTWSENVTQTGAGANDYTIGAGDITATFSASANDIGGDTTINVTLTADTNETGVNGGTEPNILYVAGNGDPVHDEALVPNNAVANGAGAITVTDDAAPFLRTDGAYAPRYSDNGSDGTIDRITLDFTENTTISYTDANWTVTAGDLTSADVTALTSGSGTTTIVLTATAATGLTGVSGGTEPQIAYAHATNIGDGTNYLTSISATNLVDAAAPQIKTLGYLDVDLDGKIDTISLYFSETLDAASVLSHENLLLSVGDFTSAAFGSAGLDLVGAVSTVDITLGTEASVVDTRSDTLVSVTTQDGVAAFSLTDGTNENTTPKAEAQITDNYDKAKPVIKTVTPTDASTAQSRTNSVVYTFSEPMAADAWVEGTEFDSTPDGSGWSGTWSGDGNLTMTLTHSPFLCVQSYSIAFIPAQIAATGGESGFTALSNTSTAPIGVTHTFTTMSCSSGSSSSSSTTTEEEEEAVVEEEETTTEDEAVVEEETSDDEITAPSTGEQAYSPVTGELEDVSVVTAGDYIKSPYFSTVYYIAEDLTRRPFMDSQTFFTYSDTFDEVSTVTDATLATLDLGSVMLPNSGVVLVKIQSDPKTYAIDEGNNLRWITTEAVANALYGANWNQYIIDIAPTFFTKFGTGADVTAESDITVSTGMKTRAELAE